MATGTPIRKRPVNGKTTVMKPQAAGATFKQVSPSGSSVSTSVAMGKPEKRFIPGDFNSKRPIDRSTTPAVGASLGENPAKTQARMSAQSEGKTSYNFGGKPEYSGRTETRRMPELSTSAKVVPAKFKMSTSTPASSGTVSVTSKKLPSSGKMMKKRKLPRVPYFEGKGYGHNKRTESGHGR